MNCVISHLPLTISSQHPHPQLVRSETLVFIFLFLINVHFCLCTGENSVVSFRSDYADGIKCPTLEK